MLSMRRRGFVTSTSDVKVRVPVVEKCDLSERFTRGKRVTHSAQLFTLYQRIPLAITDSCCEQTNERLQYLELNLDALSLNLVECVEDLLDKILTHQGCASASF